MKPQSKQQFILAQGDMPADQVVKAAKTAGLKISRAYVYVARSNARKNVRKRLGIDTGNKLIKTARRMSRDLDALREVKQQFVTLALRIGLDRASAELDRLRGGLEVV